MCILIMHCQSNQAALFCTVSLVNLKSNDNLAALVTLAAELQILNLAAASGKGPM